MSGGKLDALAMIHPSEVPWKTVNGFAPCTLAELREKKAADGVEVPTLEEVVRAVQERHMHLFLESKAAGTFSMVDAAMRERRLSWDRVTPMSFLGVELAFMGHYAFVPQKTIAGMHHAPTYEVLRVMRQEYDMRMLVVGQYLVTPQLVNQAHQLGLEIAAAVVNDPAMALDLRKTGVDALITDFPQVLSKAFTSV
jgi:glycerophosphoryl diester phosphodiesterase